MTEEELNSPKASDNEAILQQQYLRAMSSFEGIILGQMEVKSKLSDRLNYSIRAGLVILSMVAISILTLLIMLSAQINRISSVVGDMNDHFTSVSVKMENIKGSMLAMESQIALMSDIEQYTTIMSHEMDSITSNMNAMEFSISDIDQRFRSVHFAIDHISQTIHHMNSEVQMINYEMHRMSEPARAINRFLPIP